MTAVNDAPTATNLAQTLNYTEGAASVPINDIVVSDVDSGETITATLTLANTAAGSLTTSGTATYDPSTGIWTITGTVAAVNAALAAVAFVPATNNDVNTTITTHIEDASGTGPTNGTINLNVTAVNDAPVNNVPLTTQTVNEDTALVFSTNNGNAISISDADVNSGTETVTLSVLHGTLTLASTNGLSFATGDGTADATMTFSGTLSAINAALASLTYVGTANYSGSDTLTITTNDNGNSGGAALSDSDTVAITVNAVEDAPTSTSLTPNLGTISVFESGLPLNHDTLIGNFATIDADSGDTITYTLKAGSCSLFTLTTGGALSTGATGVGSGEYDITIVATDSAGQSLETTYTIWVGTTSGSDIKSFSAAAHPVMMFAINGNDVLEGSNFADVILGGSNNDSIKGGGGGDALVGGDGLDTFIYTKLTDSLAGAYDTVFDFTSGQDHFQIGHNLAGLTTGLTNTTATGNLATDLAAALTTANLIANGAAEVTISGGADAGIYLVINNSTAGYDPLTDAVIKLANGITLQTADFIV